jgi:hypothetical protein
VIDDATIGNREKGNDCGRGTKKPKICDNDYDEIIHVGGEAKE